MIDASGISPLRARFADFASTRASNATSRAIYFLAKGAHIATPLSDFPELSAYHISLRKRAGGLMAEAACMRATARALSLQTEITLRRCCYHGSWSLYDAFVISARHYAIAAMMMRVLSSLSPMRLIFIERRRGDGVDHFARAHRFGLLLLASTRHFAYAFYFSMLPDKPAVGALLSAVRGARRCRFRQVQATVKWPPGRFPIARRYIAAAITGHFSASLDFSSASADAILIPAMIC